jgi:hypothetical protein
MPAKRASSAGLRTRRDVKPRPAGLSRWDLHGSIPLAAAGPADGAIAHSSGQSATSHEILYIASVTPPPCSARRLARPRRPDSNTTWLAGRG